MDRKTYSVVYALIVVIIVIALGFYLYFKNGSGGKNNNAETDKAVVPSTTLKIQTETNPVKKVPDLNPTEKTNPFKTKNPFE